MQYYTIISCRILRYRVTAQLDGSWLGWAHLSQGLECLFYLYVIYVIMWYLFHHYSSCMYICIYIYLVIACVLQSYILPRFYECAGWTLQPNSASNLPHWFSWGSDIGRYCILHQQGGIYGDLDYEASPPLRYKIPPQNLSECHDQNVIVMNGHTFTHIYCHMSIYVYYCIYLDLLMQTC